MMTPPTKTPRERSGAFRLDGKAVEPCTWVVVHLADGVIFVTPPVVHAPKREDEAPRKICWVLAHPDLAWDEANNPGEGVWMYNPPWNSAQWGKPTKVGNLYELAANEDPGVGKRYPYGLHLLVKIGGVDTPVTIDPEIEYDDN